MKYNLKVGDKVRVKKDLKVGFMEVDGMCVQVNEYMYGLRGEYLTISTILNEDGDYDFYTCENGWLWAISMIDKIIPSSNKLKIKLEPSEFGNVIFNHRTVVLKSDNGDKTVVTATEGDEYNSQFGFLMAYFQRESGLSKTQTAKFMKSLKDEYIRQIKTQNKKQAKKQAKKEANIIDELKNES